LSSGFNAKIHEDNIEDAAKQNTLYGGHVIIPEIVGFFPSLYKISCFLLNNSNLIFK